ncbi:predicted protein [Nematostella vectensis]|uniref:Uncharacterized protein n=1 Tax=Nematostella vectensis TaxID=45351 RepID=A7RZ48_NEMVE|nr:cdc42-interacting protein 4 homolog [Nematostella vectensis]EDO43345.1 predicted protein [Nematostella vectensis]|eukprot:XP_001635408.1 predicted protein [Nematostella vectensis]
MSWGVDLWDQFDLVAAHSERGIDLVKRISRFAKERCRIEAEYAKELRKLAKSFHTKKKHEDELQYSSHKAFSDVVKETDDKAGQHELIAENMSAEIYKELHKLHSELEHEKRKHCSDAKKEQDDMDHSMRALDTSKKAYEKAKFEAEQALQAYQKAEQDSNIAKVQIEKLRGSHKEKGQAADRAKEEYQNQLQMTNNKQMLHYNTDMPAIFDEIQKMEEKRIARVGELLVHYSEVESKVMPILQKCLDNIKTIGASVDGPKDTMQLIELNKTALTPPGDIQFEECTPSRQKGPLMIDRKAKLASFWKKHKGGSTSGGNDFQSLPPGQKIRICKKKVDKFQAEYTKLQTSRDGMVKMVSAFQQNPAMGVDIDKVEQELADNAQQLDKVGEELFKYQSFLAALENKPVPDPPPKYSTSAPVQPPPAPTPVGSTPSDPPPAPSLLVAPLEEEDIEFDDDLHCTVLYEFQATNDGELSVTVGEDLQVLEMDLDDSGWTKVLKGESEGYVPTAYLQILD